MKKNSTAVTVILMCVIGTCMHFVCDIVHSENAVMILGILFPVNETTWEHMKMLWYPFLVTGIILAVKKHDRGYFGSFAAFGLLAMLVQLGLFSFYQSFTGTSVLILDIIFYMGDMILMALMALKHYQQFRSDKAWIFWLAASVLITAGIIYLTYCPGTGYVFLDDSMLA